MKRLRTACSRPYALPRVFDASTAASGDRIEMYCRWAIQAAWAAGENGRVKAARTEIARWQLAPATIAAMARSLADYNRRVCPQREGSPRLDWLSTGSGCVQRFGTEYDAHIAAWSALSAALSIIVDIPLEHPEDADAVLATLFDTGWRHLPIHQRERVARRMARYVAGCITCRPFAPLGAKA